jgi:hypothetical protein
MLGLIIHPFILVHAVKLINTLLTKMNSKWAPDRSFQAIFLSAMAKAALTVGCGPSNLFSQ